CARSGNYWLLEAMDYW
nr:immunoglobulin heavy chain junction region [Mus musculus]